MRRFPDATAYAQAFQNPQYIILDKKLASCACPKDKFGQPVSSCGSFAVTFQLKSLDRKWAVRCFLADVQDRGRRYSAISSKLNDSMIKRSGYFVDFVYADEGVLIKGAKYPIVKMDWAEGLTLGKFIELNYTNGNSIRNLRNALAQVNAFLTANHIAHGDIQPENLMVSDDGRKIQLIDYDGMFVPGMESLGAVETGVANFQHPERQKLCPWNDRLDRFSFIVLDIALSILEEVPSYWITTKSSEKKVLFDAKDFETPCNSLIFNDLKKIPRFSNQISALQQICLAPFDDIPDLTHYTQFKASSLGVKAYGANTRTQKVQRAGVGSNRAKFNAMFGNRTTSVSPSHIGVTNVGHKSIRGRPIPQSSKILSKVKSLFLPTKRMLSNGHAQGRRQGDAVGRLGIWLTRKGTSIAYYGTYFVVIGCVFVMLAIGVIKNFIDGIFSGILSLVWAFFVGAVSIPVALLIGAVATAVVWLLGKACYSKWTLAICVIVTVGIWLISSKCNGSPLMERLTTVMAKIENVLPSFQRDDRGMSQKWPKPKNWYYETCNNVECEVNRRVSDGCRYNRSLVRRIGGQIGVLRNQLANDNADASDRAYNELIQTFRAFVADCQQPVPVRCSACRGTGCDEPRSYTHNGMRIQRQKCGKCKGSGKIFR